MNYREQIEADEQWKSARLKYDKYHLVGVWFFCVVWNALSFPALFGMKEKAAQEEYWAVALMGMFPCFGLIILCFSLHRTLQKLKYGSSVFELDTNPGVIGGELRGKLKLPLALDGAEVRINLVNLRQTVRGSGKNRHVDRTILWQDDQILKSHQLKPAGEGLTTKVAFTIPFDCLDVDKSTPANQVLWKLRLHADVLGVDYAAEFDLPVFKTEESDESVVRQKVSEDAGDILLSEVPLLKGISFEEREGGCRLFLRPFRFIGTFIGCSSFAVIFLLASIFLIKQGVWYMALFFSPFVLLLGLAAMHHLLIQTEILFYNGKGRVKSSWLGLGRVYEFELSKLKTVSVAVASKTNSDVGLDSVNYTLELEPLEGRSLKLKELTSDFRQASWLAARLREELKGQTVAAESPKC